MTTTILTALVLGTFAGLAPGPYTTMVAGTALERGFQAGFVLALTPLATDIVPMLFSALILEKMGPVALTMLGIAGGAVILVVGIRFLREHSSEERPVLSEHDEPTGNVVKRRQSARVSHVIASTLLNPSPWLFWLVIASPLLLRSWNRSPGEGLVFVGLVFLTNISTATSLAWIASHGRKILNPAWQRTGLKAVGVTLMLAGGFLCWQATEGNFQNLIAQQEAIREMVEEGITSR